MITSTSNSQIKYIVQLQKKSKFRNEEGVFIIEGSKMFFEAPKKDILKIYVSENFLQEKMNKDRLDNIGMKYEIVKDEVFAYMSDTKTPQGILGVIKQFKYTLENIITYNKKKHNLLILETIQDPGNLGTILRTGEAAGTTGVIMNKETVDVYNPKVIRSTMGSLYRVPFVYVEDLQKSIELVKNKGINLYATHLKASKYYDNIDYTGNTGFLIGNEANGLSENITKLADEYIKIPMQGKVESLNAAIASSIVLFEVARQRRNISN